MYNTDSFMKAKIIQFLQDNPLYKNSFYVMASNMVLMGTGFIFWIIAARLYSTAQIGIATSLYSLLTLLSSLSVFGFGSGLMRFLPGSDSKNEKINSSILITACASLLLTTATVFALPKISPHLAFVTHNNLFLISFVIFTVMQTLNFLIEAILIALREGNQILIKNSILSTFKLLLPFTLIFMGAYGIFASLEVAVIISVIYGFIIVAVMHKIKFRPTFHKASVKQMSFFSFGNYIAGLASTAPTYILPIFITNMLGPTTAAYYYIVGTTSNVLFMVPAIITQNLLVEGSYGEKEIKIHVRKAARLLAVILIPAIAGMILFGNYLLLVFGKKYSIEGLHLLQLFALSCILVAANYIFGTIITLLHKIKLLIILNFIATGLLLLFTYLFLNSFHMGLLGIGIAAILTQTILITLYAIVFIRLNLLSLLF